MIDLSVDDSDKYNLNSIGRNRKTRRIDQQNNYQPDLDHFFEEHQDNDQDLLAQHHFENQIDFSDYPNLTLSQNSSEYYKSSSQESPIPIDINQDFLSIVKIFVSKINLPKNDISHLINFFIP